jgi:hypothetical protein
MTGARFSHSDIHGSQLGRQLPVAFRSRPRPSSALDAKASTVDSLYLGEIKMLVLVLEFSRICAANLDAATNLRRAEYRGVSGHEGITRK